MAYRMGGSTVAILSKNLLSMSQFLVGGVIFEMFLELQRQDLMAQLEEDRKVRDDAKKKALVKENRCNIFFYYLLSFNVGTV